MTIVLGVDGGATKTEAVLLDARGQVLGRGFGGPSNYNAVGIEATQRHIGEAAAAACAAAHIDRDAVDAAFLGLAAIVSAADRALIHRAGVALELAPPEKIGVDHDCRIALAGGLSGRPGIVQIAGTGSSTFGINAAGEGWRVGGWGQLISDEGSGYWLGIQAMRASVCAADGRLAGTVLYEAVMAALNLSDINDIMPLIYVQGMAKNEIAGLAPLVLDAAQGGDRAAQQIINEGADLLAECVEAAAERLGMNDETVEIALVGGLFQAGEVIVGPFRTALRSRLADFRLIPAELPPSAGAAILALELAGERLSTDAQAALLRCSW
jgi:glucosamine kinase